MRRVWLLPILLFLSPRPVCAEGVTRVALPNGLRVIVKSDPGADIVAIDALLDVSAADEPPGKEGLRQLTQRLLLRGTKDASGDEMGRRLAAVGGIADAAASLDYVELYVVVPAAGFPVAVELVADALRNPAFLPEEVAKQRRAAREAIGLARGDAFQETYLAFREALYGDHPYGRAAYGDYHSLASLGREELVAFHRAHYVPGKAVLAICGGVRPGAAVRLVRQLFGDWPGGQPAARQENPVTPLQGSEVVARELRSQRAHLILGFPAPAAGGPGYYEMQVIDSLLGGGASGRLPKALRDERGLVYQVSSFYPTVRATSHFAIYVVAEPRQVEVVKNTVLRILERLREGLPAPQELSRAKRYLLGSYALSHQRMKEQAYSLAWYEILGLGADFEQRYAEAIQAVTAAQVREAAQALLGRFVVAVGMPEE